MAGSELLVSSFPDEFSCFLVCSESFRSRRSFLVDVLWDLSRPEWRSFRRSSFGFSPCFSSPRLPLCALPDVEDSAFEAARVSALPSGKDKKEEGNDENEGADMGKFSGDDKLVKNHENVGTVASLQWASSSTALS